MIEPIRIRLAVDTSLAAESVREFITETQQAFQVGFVTAIDRAKAKLGELAQKQEIVNQTIAGEKRAIEELERKKESATAAARKQLDQEIEALKKIIENRKLELIEIDKKKVKVEEVMALSVASGEKEVAIVKAATAERTAELNVLRDTQKAHQSVGEEMSKGIAIGRNFLTVMGGFAVVSGVVSVANSYLAAMRAEMEGIANAGERMRNLAGGRFEQERKFFAENGLRTAEQQNAGRQVIDSIAVEQGIPRETVLGGAAALAPVLRKAGIAYDSTQGQSIIGHAARFGEQGVDSQGVAALTQEELIKNPKLTGEQLNQRMSNLMAAAGGSPSRLNSLLESYQTNRPQYEAAGFQLDDAAKMFSKLGENTSPTELPSVSRQAFRSLDRLLGLSPKQLAELHKSLGNYGGVQEQMLSSMSHIGGPMEALKRQEQMRDQGSAIPELDTLFEDAIKNKKDIDIKSFVGVLGKLDKDKLNRVDRAFGGSHGIVSLGRAAGFNQVAMPGNAEMMPAPQAPEVGVQVAKERAEAAARQQDPPDAGEAGFHKSTELEKTYLEHHPEYQQGISHGAGFFWSFGGGLGMAYANTEQQGAARVYERKLIQIGRTFQAIRQGKIKASPEEIDALTSNAAQIQERMGMGSWGTAYSGNWRTLGRPSGRSFNGLAEGDEGAADSILGEIDKQGEDVWATANQQLMNTPSSVTDTRKGGELLKENDRIMRSLRGNNTTPAAPAAAPAPKQGAMMMPPVINQNRIVMYGYGYDSIGGPNEHENRFG